MGVVEVFLSRLKSHLDDGEFFLIEFEWSSDGATVRMVVLPASTRTFQRVGLEDLEAVHQHVVQPQLVSKPNG